MCFCFATSAVLCDNQIQFILKLSCTLLLSWDSSLKWGSITRYFSTGTRSGPINVLSTDPEVLQNCTGFTLRNSAGLAVGECYAVKADSHVSGNRFRPKRKWTICYWRLFFMTVFIRRAPVKHNTASECIRTVAATYGCKILQQNEYDANVYGYNANCEWHPRNISSSSIQDSWLPGWGISASV